MLLWQWLRELLPGPIAALAGPAEPASFDRTVRGYLKTRRRGDIVARTIEEVRLDDTGKLRLRIPEVNYTPFYRLGAGVHWQEASRELVCEGGPVERSLPAWYMHAWLLALQVADHTLLLAPDARTVSLPEQVSEDIYAFDEWARSWFSALRDTQSKPHPKRGTTFSFRKGALYEVLRDIPPDLVGLREGQIVRYVGDAWSRHDSATQHSFENTATGLAGIWFQSDSEPDSSAARYFRPWKG